MHAHGVEVLDGTHDDDVVGQVAHDLELVLLPTFDRRLDQDLGDGAGGQAFGGHRLELFHRRCDARPSTSEDEARPHDDR